MEFGTELGAKGDFAGCVKGAKNAAAVTAETRRRSPTRRLQTDGQFGTPTVVANGAQVDLNNTGWLKAIIVGAGRAGRPAPGRRRGDPGAPPGQVVYRSSRQGAVAQLVAHLTGSQRVRGSNPLSSTLAVATFGREHFRSSEPVSR